MPPPTHGIKKCNTIHNAKRSPNASKACFVCGNDYKTSYHTLDGLRLGEGAGKVGGFELRLQVLIHHNNCINAFQHRNKLSTKNLVFYL